MNIPFIQLVLFLLAGIAAIILLTVRFKVHPFFALSIACFITGMGIGLPVEKILTLMKAGFGDILSKLTIIIVLGTTIGTLLEKNGSTQVMAEWILRLTGPRRSSLAISITGFIVGLPIFCDSGFIVLSGLNRSLAKRSGIAIAQMSVSLASGLYAVHCLIPPHPGATAAASSLAVDMGKLILIGLVIAIPAMLVGHAWAVFAGRKGPGVMENIDGLSVEGEKRNAPHVLPAFLPVIVPIILMAVRSIIGIEDRSSGMVSSFFSVLGDPAIALAVGVLLALLTGRYEKNEISRYLSSAAEKAGGILVIIGAGGAFGAVLAAADIGKHFSELMDLKTVGLFFPFLLTFIVKTAQGSSTVAIVTASSIILPLLPVLGLDSDNARLLTVLSMGAGSMMISHTNDAYFWVIARFSGIDVKTMLKVYSVASLWMGIVTMGIVYLLSLWMM
jgi:gluconate:H+ symporter, GntP family